MGKSDQGALYNGNPHSRMRQSGGGGVRRRPGLGAAPVPQPSAAEPLEQRLLLAVLYVDLNAPGPLHDGSSWPAAYVDLQPALLAAQAGDEIRLATGTYKPTPTNDRTQSFRLKSGVSLLGGYPGSSSPTPNTRNPQLYPTTLSGEIGDPAKTTDNSYHVLYAQNVDSTTLLDGLTITAGNANRSSDYYDNDCYGGGMYNSAASPTLRNCVFIANTAANFGGAIYNAKSSAPTLTNCTFTRNTASSTVGRGGALYNDSSSPTLINCAFNGNSAKGTSNSGGGAIYSDWYNSRPKLVNCTFVGNTAVDRGGAIFIYQGTTTLTNCTFAWNSTTGSSGAGDAIHNTAGSPTLVNCILWGKPITTGPQIYGGAIVSYSDIQGGFAGTGNLKVDPRFIRNPSPGPDNQWGTADDDYGNLRLQATSPCLEVGSNSSVPTEIVVDLAGNPRLIGNRVDLGAYETLDRPVVVTFAASAQAVLETAGTITVTLTLSQPSQMPVTVPLLLEGTAALNRDYRLLSPNPLVFEPGSTSASFRIEILDDTRYEFTDTLILRLGEPTNAWYSTSTPHTITITDNDPAPSVLYVDDTANGDNDGSSWADACTSLQAALQAVAAGGVIYVAAGTYTPGTLRTDSFQLRSQVAVYGGFPENGGTWQQRNPAVNPTILSGEIGDPAKTTDNSYHVVYGKAVDGTAILDGLTITAGNANGSSSNQLGGGIYNSNSSSPTLTNCNFRGNNGSAMHNSSSSPTLTNCTFVGNSGGGMSNAYSSSPTLTNCAFIGNNDGGMHNASSSPTLTNCAFVGNNSSAMSNVSSSSPTLTNCILWGNSFAIYNSGSTPTVTYCDIQGGYSGTGNINADPQFLRNPSVGSDRKWGTADDDYGDLRLPAGSPCIDAGSNAALPSAVTADLEGKPRLLGSTVDLGAFELPDLPIVSFAAADQQVSESGGTITMTLNLSRPAQMPITVPLVLDGNAGLNRDYRLLSPNPLVFEPGSTTSSFEIQILDDRRYDPGESIVMHLGELTEVWYGAIATHTITIGDDDEVPVLYVDSTAKGANSGVSWTDAYTSLQTALQWLEGDPAAIWVSAGIYNPGMLRTDSFQLRSHVATYGGFPQGGGTWEQRDPAANPTILSGEIGNPGTTSDNNYHVVTANGVDATAILDGFTITAGYANQSGNDNGYGGGIFLASSSPTLTNCAFSGNFAFYGGGLGNLSSSPKLINCSFTGNSAAQGGGMHNRSSSPILTNCAFVGNSGDKGGGMYNESSSSANLVNCSFIENSASKTGGGMYNLSSSPTLTHCTFVENWSIEGGGGMYNYNSSSPTLANCIIWGNGSAIYNSGSTPTVTYCDIQGGYSGTGNLNADPQFLRSPWPGPDGVFGTADDDWGDLRLRLGSPALNVGSNAAVPADCGTDLAGNARIQDSTVDLGAYEGAVAAPGPKTIYVDQNASGANNGSSWVDAYSDLQSALAAAVDGDSIRIADGTYKPTVTNNRTISFALRRAVAIYGGYAGFGASNPDARDIIASPTILSGEIGDLSTTQDNSYHVVTGTTLGSSAILDGITITLGNANAHNSNRDRGAGLYLESSSPTLNNCAFVGNNASSGAGMYNYFSTPMLTNCTFADASFGGGMYNDHSSPTLTNCNFSRNSGGGMSNDSSSPTLTNCAFVGNSAPSGGGMSNGYSSSPTLINCTFFGNSATGFLDYDGGGGIYNYSTSPTLINCSFVGNSARGYHGGGGMYNAMYSSPTLTNCTFVDNIAAYGCGGIYNSYSSPRLTNCIIWGTSSSISNLGTTPTATYCDILGGYGGIGCFDADPQFLRNPSPGLDGTWGTADDDYGDLRLQPTSPAINAGDNAAIPAGITTDLAGNPRIQGGTVDLGAYESQPTDLTLTGSPTDSFLLRLTNSALEIFRNTSPDQAPPTQSLPFSSLTHLHLQGGHYTLASNLTGLNLQLENDTQVRLLASQHLASLTLSGNATLDVADHDLILSATPETKAAVLAAISSAIKSARGGDGKWLGAGLSSTSAQANKQTGLAVMLNEKNGQPILTTFAGQPVAERDILIKYTWNGDVNLDGVVDASDYFLMDSGFITQAGQYRNGDLNLDGAVDAGDYFLIDSAFIAQAGVLAAREWTPRTVSAESSWQGPVRNSLAELFSTNPLLEG